jgi:hypothetical protein
MPPDEPVITATLPSTLPIAPTPQSVA